MKVKKSQLRNIIKGFITESEAKIFSAEEIENIAEDVREEMFGYISGEMKNKTESVTGFQFSKDEIKKLEAIIGRTIIIPVMSVDDEEYKKIETSSSHAVFTKYNGPMYDSVKMRRLYNLLASPKHNVIRFDGTKKYSEELVRQVFYHEFVHALDHAVYVTVGSSLGEIYFDIISSIFPFHAITEGQFKVMATEKGVSDEDAEYSWQIFSGTEFFDKDEKIAYFKQLVGFLSDAYGEDLGLKASLQKFCNDNLEDITGIQSDYIPTEFLEWFYIIINCESVDGLTSQINNFKNAFNFMNAANFERIFRDNEKEKGLMV